MRHSFSFPPCLFSGLLSLSHRNSVETSFQHNSLSNPWFETICSSDVLIIEHLSISHRLFLHRRRVAQRCSSHRSILAVQRYMSRQFLLSRFLGFSARQFRNPRSTFCENLDFQNYSIPNTTAIARDDCRSLRKSAVRR